MSFCGWFKSVEISLWLFGAIRYIFACSDYTNKLKTANLKARIARSFAPVYPHMLSEGSPQKKIKWNYVADVRHRRSNDHKLSWILVLEGEI